MTISAEGKYQNVKASIEKYIHTNLVGTEGLVVDFEGMPFEVAHRQEWIQERIIGTGDWVQHRHVDYTGNRGQSSTVLLSFNIFVNKENTRKTNRVYEIRDTIANYFHEGKRISLYDFENANFTNSMQELVIESIDTDSAIPDDDYWQYNYTIGISWIQKWRR